MLTAIIALATLQVLAILAVLILHFGRNARNNIAKKSENRTKRYDKHIVHLLLDSTDIGFLQRAVKTKDRKIVLEKMLKQAELLKGTDKDNMTDAFERLGYVAQEIKAIASNKWWRRLEAAVNLGNMRSQEAVEPLIAAARDSNRDVRLAVLNSLGQTGTGEGLRVLLDALEIGRDWTSVNIFEILASFGPEIESEIVPRIAASRRPPSLLLYVELCGQLRLLNGVSPLQALADDPDSRVRAAVAKALGMIGQDSSLETLNRLLTDQIHFVRREAALALGRLGSIESGVILQRALDDSDWQVRRNAAVSLCRLGPAAGDLLREVSVSGTAEARCTVAHVIELNRLGIPIIG